MKNNIDVCKREFVINLVNYLYVFFCKNLRVSSTKIVAVYIYYINAANCKHIFDKSFTMFSFSKSHIFKMDPYGSLCNG